MTGYRRAAVALHGIADEDRSWVLNALPPADRDTLIPLLDELIELGFAEYAGVTDELSEDANRPGSDAPVSSSDQLREASVEQMFSILENEPASLIAQFLSLERWTWSKDFLDLFPPARRERILASVTHSLAIAPARAAFLKESVGKRLSEITPASGYHTETNQANEFRRRVDVVFSPLRRLVAAWTR